MEKFMYTTKILKRKVKELKEDFVPSTCLYHQIQELEIAILVLSEGTGYLAKSKAGGVKVIHYRDIRGI